MSYVEKKKVNGEEYFYLSKNVRVSGKKWKKIRKYLGKDLSNIQAAQAEIELVMPVKRALTFRQMKILELLKSNCLKKHKTRKPLWKAEKDQIVGFIYNTNAIEGNSLSYEDTKDVLEGRKPRGKYVKRDMREVQNMKKCIDFLFNYNGELNQGLLLKLHKMELEGVHAKAGKIRVKQNIVGNYIPPKPEDVPAELEKFFSWHRQAQNTLHPFETAVLAHLKLVRIHPFMEGNGRICRLLMNHIMLKNGYPLLNIFNSEKMFYYLVLREVDATGKERAFVKYLYEIYLGQYREYLTA